MSVESKIGRLRKKKYCTTCLRTGHEPEACPSNPTCYNCKGTHHRVLCTNSVASLTMMGSKSEIILPSGHVKFEANSTDIWARFLLDCGAERTFISTEYARKLNLKTLGYEKFFLHSFGSEPKLTKCRMVEFDLCTRDGREMKFSALVIPQTAKKASPLLPSIRKFLKAPAERINGPEEISIG